MAPIQICRSRCKSTSIYVAVAAGSEVEIDLGEGSGFREPKASLEELGVTVPDILASFFSFAMAH